MSENKTEVEYKTTYEEFDESDNFIFHKGKILRKTDIPYIEMLDELMKKSMMGDTDKDIFKKLPISYERKFELLKNILENKS